MKQRRLVVCILVDPKEVFKAYQGYIIPICVSHVSLLAAFFVLSSGALAWHVAKICDISLDIVNWRLATA